MTVSIVMAVYNGMPYLQEAVESILNQSYRDFELIVIDDGSTDGSPAYLRTIADKRLVVKRTAQSGPGRARNVGIQLSRGRYIAFMDADDIAMPQRIALQAGRLEQDRDLAVVGARIEYFATGGKRGFAPPLALGSEQIRIDLMAGRHALVNSALMFRGDVLRQLGGFRIDGVGEDWDLFLRATELGPAANLEQVLLLCRIHAASTNAKQRRTLRLRYAYACECARSREQGLAERSFEEFISEDDARPLLQRWASKLDEFATVQYRQSMFEILSKRTLLGYPRLAFSAGLSPARLAQRIERQIRPRPPQTPVPSMVR